MGNNELLRAVKERREDFEWYPTTNKIIRALYHDIHKEYKHKDPYSIPCIDFMDIGAGDGKIFKVFNEISEETEVESQKVHISAAYAIEKSLTLIQAMHEDIFVVGTDFWNQTLLDKKVDVIYTNPPYSEFSAWGQKVIKEANSHYVYLLIPERWEKDKDIRDALEQRKATAKIVGAFSFENSEDRKARAKVHLIRVDLVSGRYKIPNSDPFELWFKEAFPIEAPEKKEEDYDKRKKKQDHIREVVRGGHLVERLEELYNKDMAHLYKNYQAVTALDGDLLEELGVSQDGLQKALKQKIEGLKYVYWHELFDNLEKITKRLTKKSRESLLQTLTSHTSVDFTSQNAYAIVIWVIKNANKYFDKQLLDLYWNLTKVENIRLYKSNQRTIIDDWRYLKEEMSHYALDYRIVLRFYQTIGGSSYDSVNGLGAAAATTLGDIIAVAGNLGFDIVSRVDSSSMVWESGKKNNFYLRTSHPLDIGTKTAHGKIEDVHLIEETGRYQYLIGDDWYHESMVGAQKDTFMEVKGFKNGNLHIKFNQAFMKALNIEAARLNGWIKSPQEACEEFDIGEEEAKEMFGKNFCLGTGDMGFLLPSVGKEVRNEA